MGSAKPATETKTTASTTAPWTPAQPYLTDLYAKAHDALGMVSQNAYGGQRVANEGELTQQGYAAGQQAATAASTGVDQMRALALKSLNGDYLDPSKNTALQGAIKAAIQPQQDNLLRSVIPGISSQAQMSGAYGGARQGVQNALALSDFDKNALNTSSTLTYQDYQNERNNQLNAGNILSQAHSLDSSGAAQLLALGGQQDAHQQALLSAQKAAFDEQQQAPFTGMQTLASILTAGGYNQQNGNSTTVSTPAQASGISQVLGGLLSAGSLAANFIPGAGTVATPLLSTASQAFDPSKAGVGYLSFGGHP